MTTDTDMTHDHHTCITCGEAYPIERLLILRRDARHPDDLDDEGVETYHGAHHEEEAGLRSSRVRMSGVIMPLYPGFLMLFTVFTS